MYVNSTSHRISRAHEWSSVMEATCVVLMKEIFKSASWLLCSLVMNLLIQGSQS